MGVSALKNASPSSSSAPLAGTQPPSSRLTASPPHRLATKGTTHTSGPPCPADSSSWLFWSARLFEPQVFSLWQLFTLEDFQTHFKLECKSCRVLLDKGNVPRLFQVETLQRSDLLVILQDHTYKTLLSQILLRMKNKLKIDNNGNLWCELHNMVKMSHQYFSVI